MSKQMYTFLNKCTFFTERVGTIDGSSGYRKWGLLYIKHFLAFLVVVQMYVNDEAAIRQLI